MSQENGKVLVVLVVAIALSACGDDGDKPGVIQPKGPDPAAVPFTHEQKLRLPVVRGDSRRAQYRESKRICRMLGPARIAYENDEAGTITEIAKEWAERTAVKPAWRKATFDGCVAGFRG